MKLVEVEGPFHAAILNVNVGGEMVFPVAEVCFTGARPLCSPQATRLMSFPPSTAKPAAVARLSGL